MKHILVVSILVFIIVVVSNCDKKISVKKIKVKAHKIYTKPSTKKNKYLNFNSPNAVNKIATIENEYFNSYTDSISKYYGTFWYETTFVDSLNLYDQF